MLSDEDQTRRVEETGDSDISRVVRLLHPTRGRYLPR